MVQWWYLHFLLLRDLCPQAESLQRAGPIVAVCLLGNLVVSFLPLKKGGSGSPQGDSRLTEFLSVGVTLCLPVSVGF